jgi:hypothetical protein
MKYFSALIIIFLIFSCKQKEIDTATAIYSEKSIELINDVLSSEYNFCECLLEPPNKTTLQTFADDVPHFDYEKYILESFDLNIKSGLNELHGINDSLVLKPNSLGPNIKIIYRKEWNEIFSKYGFDARDTIYKRYPNLCFLTKPIFDKDYKIAIADIDIGGCLWHPPFKIRLNDGKWQFE